MPARRPAEVLKDAGVEVVLVNSNPATIMTDGHMADHVYIEPLTLPTLRRIIEKEQPDSILPTLGGQTGLTLAMQLAKEGFLEEHGVKLLGAKPDTINRAEDRQTLQGHHGGNWPARHPLCGNGIPVKARLPSLRRSAIRSSCARRSRWAEAAAASRQTRSSCSEIAQRGLRMSPIHQILVEQCIAGWKEIEFEVMRDSAGNCITVCSMENFDPVGVHTGRFHRHCTRRHPRG